jgi:hypothetical protein
MKDTMWHFIMRKPVDAVIVEIQMRGILQGFVQIMDHAGIPRKFFH